MVLLSNNSDSVRGIIDWLLDGDVSVRYQTIRDLLSVAPETLISLHQLIGSDGWGKQFLEKRDAITGMWGNGSYSPKWISTHYTLLDLKNIGLAGETGWYRGSAEVLLQAMWHNNGEVRKKRYQDMCIAGMLLSICCHAKINNTAISEIINYILEHQFTDGGWNCRWQNGAVHSSLHTTISVLEGLQDVQRNGYSERTCEIVKAAEKGREFILAHHFFRSSRTGEVIHEKFLQLSFPCRWYYDILRALDHFREAGAPYDTRMDDALDSITAKMRTNDRWPVQHKHPGLVHFDMERTGSDSRWNTLRALRVLRQYRPELYTALIARNTMEHHF